MDVHQRHLDAGLLLAADGNRLLGEQLRGLEPAGAAAYDAAFAEEGWPPNPGRQPFALSVRPIIAATSVACDLARLLMFLDQGGAILTSDLLCRYVLEATATGTWILRPGMAFLDEPWPDDRERFMDETRRRRIERAHIVRWTSMSHYRSGQPKGRIDKRAVADWKAALAGRVSEVEEAPGRVELVALDGTEVEGLAKMARALTAETFTKDRKLPDVYTQLSAYGHPNVDAIAEMEGPDGMWRRDAAEMVAKLWTALHLVARAWEMFAAYAGADLEPVHRWRDSLAELDLST